MARFFFRPFQWLRPKRRPVATFTVPVAVAATGVATAWTSAVGLLTAVAAAQGVAVATTSPVGSLTATAQATGVATVWTQPAGRLEETGAKGVATVWTQGVGVLNATAQATGVAQVWTSTQGALSIPATSVGTTPATTFPNARVPDDDTEETRGLFMQASGSVVGSLDLNAGTTMGDPIVLDVSLMSHATLQVTLKSGSWSGAVVEFQRGNDKTTFAPLETAVTFGAPGLSRQVDVRGVSFVAAVVKTTQVGAATVGITIFANG